MHKHVQEGRRRQRTACTVRVAIAALALVAVVQSTQLASAAGHEGWTHIAAAGTGTVAEGDIDWP